MKCSVDAARQEDCAEISKFLPKVFGGDERHHLSLLRHWTTDNPHWREGMPFGWTARNDSGKLIGFTANIPLKYVVNGRTALCIVTGTTSVSGDGRGLGVGTRLGRAFTEQPSADLLIGAGSTDIALRMWRKLGGLDPQRDWGTRAARVLAEPGLISGKLPRSLQRFGRLVEGAWIDTAQSRVSGPCGGLDVRQIEHFDPGWEADFENIFALSGRTTFAWRDPEILNWLHFGNAALARMRVVIGAFDGGRLAGYLSMKREGAIFKVLECQTRNADPEICTALVQKAQRLARDHKAQYVLLWKYAPMLEKAAPRFSTIYARSPSPMSYCYWAPREKIDLAYWETTPGDGDLSLF